MQKMKWYHGLIVFGIFVVMSQAIGLVFLLSKAESEKVSNKVSVVPSFKNLSVPLDKGSAFLSRNC